MIEGQFPCLGLVSCFVSRSTNLFRSTFWYPIPESPTMKEQVLRKRMFLLLQNLSCVCVCICPQYADGGCIASPYFFHSHLGLD
jgi:hypothetical protein